MYITKFLKYFPVSGTHSVNFTVSGTCSGKFPVSGTLFRKFSGTHSRIPFRKDIYHTEQNSVSSGTFSIMEMEKNVGKFPDGNRNWNSSGKPS